MKITFEIPDDVAERIINECPEDLKHIPIEAIIEAMFLMPLRDVSEEYLVEYAKSRSNQLQEMYGE